MSDMIAVLDQLNRDIAELEWKHRRNGEESYPGQPGELNMATEEYERRTARCEDLLAIATGIALARQVVVEARQRIEERTGQVSTPATPNQKRYVYSLSIDLGIRGEIDDQCRERYGVPVDGLTKAQAAETIERLKGELDALAFKEFRKEGVID